MLKDFKHKDLLLIGLLFAVTVVVFSSFIFSDKIMVSSDQFGGVGVREYINETFSRHGQIPVWLNGRLSGMPSIDAKFGDIFYPPTAILRPFVPAYRLHGVTMTIHVFLAGLFFFLMLRRSFLSSRLVSFAGALFYMLSPQFVSHVQPGHDGKMFVIAWLPFVVWRLRSMLAKPTLRNAALFAVGVAMVILTGHVQMAYFVLMGVFLYWITDIVRGVIVDKDDKKKVALKAVFFWAAVFVGLGIACVQLYPSYMFVRDVHSVRGIDRGFEFATSWSMHWAEFFSLWVHEFGNSLEYYWGKNFFKLNTEYAGAIPLLLAFLAVASKPKSVWRILWAAIAVLAVIYSMGANTPIFKLFYYLVPGVRRFRAPSMIMFWFTFGTALLSALFIKDLLGKRFDELKADSRKMWTTGLFIALGGVTLLAAMFSSESIAASFAAPMLGDMDPARSAQVFKINYDKKFVPNLWLWWLFAVVPLGMLLAVVNGKLKPFVLVYTLIAISVIDMSKVNAQFIQVDSKWKYFYRDDAELTRLKAEFDKTPFRVFSLPRTFATQNQEEFYGLEGVGGFHDNELNCYRAFRGDQSDLNYLMDVAEPGEGGLRLSGTKIRGNTPFLDLASVDYVLMAGQAGVQPIKNPTNLGRLSYARDFVVVENEDRIVNDLRFGRGYDYRTTVALLEEPELPYSKKSPSANANVVENVVAVDTVDDNGIDNVVKADSVDINGTDARMGGNPPPPVLGVKWKRYSPNQRIADVTMPDDGFLRISEVYYPGWEIKVNGEPVKYYRSDIAWMAVPLKAGNYEVVMEPGSLYLSDSIWITVICSLLVIAILGFELIRRYAWAKTEN